MEDGVLKVRNTAQRQAVCGVANDKEPAMTGYEFWRDVATGKVWAVELVEGDVTGACGPLSGSKIERSWLPTYPYDRVAGAEVQRRRDEFALISEAELLLLSAGAD